MIALRRATQADVPAITALVSAAYTPWIEIMGRVPGPMRFDYAKMVERHIIDLHHSGEDLVALVEMEPTQAHLTIVNVAVAPGWQGRGIGRALMAHAEAVAREHGLAKTWLFTNKLMDSNQSLYARLGYRFEHEAPFLGGTIVHMSKTLP